MKTLRAPAHGVHRFASPWIRNLFTGEVRREDGHGNTLVLLAAGAPQTWKTRADAQLRGAGYLLIDVPGDCIIETEKAEA